MQTAWSHVNALSCAVVYQARVAMVHNFDPLKLEQELRNRAHNSHVEVERVTDRWNNEAHARNLFVYVLTFARERDLDTFHEALRAIENDVAQVQEANRLLGLLARDAERPPETDGKE